MLPCCWYRFGLVGDMGWTKDAQSTLDHLAASDVDSVINVGDISYADGDQTIWYGS